jgi:hypothetical protein
MISLSSLRPAILAKPIRPVHPTFSVLPHSTHLPLTGTFSYFSVIKLWQLFFSFEHINKFRILNSLQIQFTIYNFTVCFPLEFTIITAKSDVIRPL